MPRYRQLPDGTWLDEQYNTVTAPVVDPLGTGTYKRGATPGAGPRGVPFRGPTIGTHARFINGEDGMGLYYPGWAGVHARHGRNYGALGIFDNLSPAVKNMLMIGAVIGVAGLTVWLSRKGAGRSKK